MTTSRLTRAEQADIELTMSAPPTTSWHYGFIWHGPEANDDGQTLDRCWFWRPIEPFINRVDLMLLPICGRGHIYLGDGSELIAHRGSRILIPAGVPFWVIPQNMMSDAFCCDLFTWPRFQRWNVAHQPEQFLRSDLGQGRNGVVNDAWHRSLRERFDGCVPVEVDAQVLPPADQLDPEQII